ncbi:hypothetical protein MBLNU13_g10101t1 [Cladosporium sp. NU13]
MPCIRSRKISSGALPYPTSKPEPTIKTPTTKKPNGKAATATTAAAAAAAAVARKHDNLINAMLESEFLKPESPLPSTALGDLSNPILRVFKATNFLNVKDYSVIEPSVRLASHLLKHPSLRPMLRTILKHGDMIPVGEKSRSGKPLYEYPDGSADEMTDDDVALIDTALDDLAQFVIFQAKREHTPANAITEALVRKAPKRDHTTATLRGHRSKIEYSLALLRLLEKASKLPPSKRDKPLLLVWRFTFAVQLAHEVCHALTNAKDGRLKAFGTEPFFHGALTAEVGFTIEEALFGGSPSLLWADEQPNDEDATRVHHRSKDVAWRIPLEDLVRFFDTAFWAQEDPDTLFDHSVGFTFTSNNKGERFPAEVSKQDLGRYATSAFKISKRKAIVKK